MAIRNLKISDVHEGTGISRTTLMSIASGESQGIQYGTLETLCNYLKIEPYTLFKKKVYQDD
ncbi:XRE family transcriptional regulator [Macrococcus bovicus]|uniref:XRE family transcriptional regulator n=2 Tax=Macrococcus bovicus TaxID=69968 RepID=A0A4R6BWB5_9STAP|nr:XRE family transcriptional regulator [Macrococcus bovicus]